MFRPVRTKEQEKLLEERDDLESIWQNALDEYKQSDTTNSDLQYHAQFVPIFQAANHAERVHNDPVSGAQLFLPHEVRKTIYRMIRSPN